MRLFFLVAFTLTVLAPVTCGQQPPAPTETPTELRTNFEVRYVAPASVYVNGGRDEGLQEGFHLTVKRLKSGDPLLSATTIARLVVTAVSAHSAVCDIESSTLDPEIGDTAQISQQDLESLQVIQQSKTARRYAQVITFTEGDPLDQELRDYTPHPPSPEVNRLRGRISYEFNSISDHEAGLSTLQHGIALRMDANRLGGTFWNFTGYWRGRINTSTSPVQTLTLQDLVNRTYHIGLFYNNPQSLYSIGVGRVYIPWATSLDTIDGGYFARRFGRRARLGAFAGSTPDPTAWNYKPNRQIAGVFANTEIGSFEKVRFTATAGLAVTRLSWKAERQFAFTESSFSYKQRVSFYHNLEADQLVPGRLGNTESGAVISRSFFTARLQPLRWLTLDLNHNYFRTIPTFDLVLVGTGLLDKFLFTGLSGGLRLELPGGVSVYGSLGQNKRNDDVRKSLNQMYGVGFRNIFNTGIRADIRRSVFNGAYGTGWYQSLQLSREIGERLRVEISGGQQEFRSVFTDDNRGFFMNSNIDWFLSRHYGLGGGINLYRGKIQNYDQTFFSVSYRF
jgi:hypothetical protein